MVDHWQRLQRGDRGRFDGERLNLESVPRLSALAVRLALDDPARRPYLFAWKNDVGKIVEAVVARRHDRFREWPRGPSAELWRRPAHARSRGWTELGTLYRRLPRGAGLELLLLCWRCMEPRRFLYGWEKAGNHRFRFAAGWICRACAGLSFASEGQFDPWGCGYPRPEPWGPYVEPWSLAVARKAATRARARSSSSREQEGRCHGGGGLLARMTPPEGRAERVE